MNALQNFIQRESIDEREAMDELQENGVISDCAVHACDQWGREDDRRVKQHVQSVVAQLAWEKLSEVK